MQPTTPHTESKKPEHRIVLVNGMLAVGNIKLKSGMSQAEMDSALYRSGIIQKLDKSPDYLYYRIAPVTYQNHTLEFGVHFLYNVFQYISFTIYNADQDDGGLLSVFYRNNRFIEELLGNRQYQRSASSSDVRYDLGWGSILSRYDRSRVEAICFICFHRE